MVNLKDIVARGGYLVDGATGEKVIFYECDPAKNTVCDKQICRADGAENDGGLGLCSKTLDPRFRKDGGRAWYAVQKTPDEGEPYWGREYIEVK
jgi:hypothetical protein